MPSRPPTEGLAAFCLACGGVLFFLSDEEIAYAAMRHAYDDGFAFLCWVSHVVFTLRSDQSLSVLQIADCRFGLLHFHLDPFHHGCEGLGCWEESGETNFRRGCRRRNADDLGQ